MRRLLAVSTTVVLTLTLAGATVAQEEPPATSPAASEASEEATTMTQPLPMAYWGEWDLHRQAARHRIYTAITNVDNARAKKASFYRSLIRVYDDELQWLSNHAPEDCYADEFEAWLAAVEELHASGKEAAALAKKGNKGGLKKAAKRREAAWTELEALAFTSPSGNCDHAAEPMAEPPMLAGKWLAKPVIVQDGGLVDKSTRKLTIGDDGKLLIQVPGQHVCRDGGRGSVTLIVKGTGEVVTEGRPGFAWLMERVDCQRKGRGRERLGGPREEATLLAYDPGADVLLQDGTAECYWRVDGGSKKDCQAFWQGTPPQPEEVDDPVEADDMTEAEPSAAPDESAG